VDRPRARLTAVGPAPAVAAVRSAVRAVLSPHSTVLVACSGGADSLALAAAAAFEAPRVGCRAGLVTVDHGLQPGSAAVARRVAALGYELGLDPVEVVPVQVGRAGGPEAAARTARYAALDAAALALDGHVLLGHTLDDQAETVLLGLGRGSGPRSVAGMRAVEGRYRRPLLGLRRSVMEAACAALGLEPWADPHNADPAFQRVRLRREALPLLEDVLQGGVAEALARTAALLQDDLDALDAWAAAVRSSLSAAPPSPSPSPVINSGKSARSGGESRVDHEKDAAPDETAPDESLEVAGLAGLPRAVRTRVLRAWAQDGGADPLTAERTAAVDALVTAWHGQGPIQLSGGVSVRRVSGRLELTREPTEESR
jgi:tRNA(Ile)-lysidine synthase